MKLTQKENEIITAYNELMFKLEWLKEHPGKTRRDYSAGLKDDNSNVWKWRRAIGEHSIADEKAAWERAFPGIPYDNVSTCAAQHYPKESALFDAWQRGRATRP